MGNLYRDCSDVDLRNLREMYVVMHDEDLDGEIVRESTSTSN